MSRLVALTLMLGVLAAAGTASAAVYVPGHIRDGVYTRPHFLDAPETRYDRPAKMDGEQGKLPKPPKPTLGDEVLPSQKLPNEAPSEVRS